MKGFSIKDLNRQDSPSPFIGPSSTFDKGCDFSKEGERWNRVDATQDNSLALNETAATCQLISGKDEVEVRSGREDVGNRGGFLLPTDSPTSSLYTPKSLQNSQDKETPRKNAFHEN
ncbi:hypothetical protein CEXT_590951 [Caerostris extrusa]|uniref:Uncharacterized protein n=1 Tax=Caerostris extrusa TaxID=172846 RepID=A0AAV4S636_CAEEX|nr:hypothetical protein CEXT_590951 [Caerostris extrusa]